MTEERGDGPPLIRMDLGGYFLAFVDLLGQSGPLARIAGIPDTEDERHAIDTALHESAYVVRGIRDEIARYLAASREMDPEVVAAVAPEHLEEFWRIHTLKAFHWGFSDSFVIAIPLRAEEGFAPEGFARCATEIFNALHGLAAVSLICLSNGIPLRAGIEIGYGVEVYPGEVYGPVLLTAFHLESGAAEYPRTVIGDTLLPYLNSIQAQPMDRHTSRHAARIAEDCKRYICRAPDDGRLMLHFLSPALAEKDRDAFDASRRSALEWAEGRLAIFRDKGDAKLVGRYERLLKYLKTFRGDEGPTMTAAI